jgi:alkylation response protein AidB-like acyl-CoA dehydrogenase
MLRFARIQGSFDAEYLTTAVRTGGPGAGGVSLLLIEKKFGGVKTRRLKTMGHHTTKTCLVEFKDVKVPVENLIGEYGKGFSGFDGERTVRGIGG